MIGLTGTFVGDLRRFVAVAAAHFVGRLEFSGTHTGSVTVTDLNDRTYIIVYLKSTSG